MSGVYKGEVKPPDFGDPSQYDGAEVRCLGTNPAEHASERPNFAGHYVIEACTCGSGCHFLFMWDAATGRLFYRDLPFQSLNIGPFTSAGSRSPQITYSGEEYRLDSDLLIIEACFGETCDCAKRFYLWTGSRFKLVQKQAVQLPTHCLTRKQQSQDIHGPRRQ